MEIQLEIQLDFAILSDWVNQLETQLEIQSEILWGPQSEK